MNKSFSRISETELARLGGGVLGYVREIEPSQARSLLGQQAEFPAQAKLFALYGADGSPISISGSREAAVSDALSHDLIPASLH
jgi:hypothetical protein